MLSGKYISSKAIIDSMFSQYGFNAQDISEDDIYEHIYDAMALMAVPNAYVARIAFIDIVDHYGKIPCDFFSIDDGGIMEVTTKQPLIYSNDIYFLDPNSGVFNNAINDHPEAYPQPINVDGVERDIVYFDGNMPSLVGVNQIDSSQMTYHFEAKHIIVGFIDGQVEMSYKAFPSEEMNGKRVPLVPDNVRYIMGVKAYTAERLGYFLWMKDKLSDKKYAKMELERDWYIGSGSNSARIPSLDQMENIKNDMLTLVHDPFHHKRGFRNLGQRNGSFGGRRSSF